MPVEGPQRAVESQHLAEAVLAAKPSRWDARPHSSVKLRTPTTRPDAASRVTRELPRGEDTAIVKLA
jgi:hypothetical protein